MTNLNKNEFTLGHTQIAKGIAIGEARGEARGIEKNKTEMIQSMLREKASIDFIAKVAKLTKEQIIEIGKQVSLL